MLRIAHLIESDGPGGAERVVADLATSFQAAGSQNVVFLPADGEGWLARQLDGSGVAIDYFRIDAPFSPACARSLAAAFRRHRIAIAHSHEFSMAVYGAWASWLAGGQHVITMHGSRYYAGRLRRRAALRRAIAMSGQTVAVSNPLANQMSRDLLVRRSRISTIANGVHPAHADGAAVRRELRLERGDRLIVAVGNLYPVKGHQHLVDALALIADRHPTTHLAICGRGELEETLRARARDRGLPRLHLLGLRPDVSAVLAAADLFVLPSLSEGLPLALLEAMFAGRPIVASDVGEIAATLGGGEAGVLVPAGDTAALGAAIDDLLTHPARAAALGERARARAAAQHDVSHMARGYRAIYDRLLTHITLPVARLSAGSARSNP